MLWDIRGQMGVENYVAESYLAGQFIGLVGGKNVEKNQGTSCRHARKTVGWSHLSGYL